MITYEQNSGLDLVDTWLGSLNVYVSDGIHT